jgi:putative endonuclease
MTLTMTEWFVYVVTNPAGIAYTGIAKDVEARIAKHNDGTGAKFTRGRGPWTMIHLEGPFSHGDALRREIAIKRDAAFKSDLKAGRRNAPAAAFHCDDRDLPTDRGAYILLIELAEEIAIALPRRTPINLSAGRYVYCGSAYGPGGIAAQSPAFFK